jgi:hypothetical protein
MRKAGPPARCRRARSTPRAPRAAHARARVQPQLRAPLRTRAPVLRLPRCCPRPPWSAAVRCAPSVAPLVCLLVFVLSPSGCRPVRTFGPDPFPFISGPPFFSMWFISLWRDLEHARMRMCAAAAFACLCAWVGGGSCNAALAGRDGCDAWFARFPPRRYPKTQVCCAGTSVPAHTHGLAPGCNLVAWRQPGGRACFSARALVRAPDLKEVC